MNELRHVEPVVWQVYVAYVRTYARTWPPGNGESRHQVNGSWTLRMGGQNKSILHVLRWDWRDPYGNQQFFSGPGVSLRRSRSDILSGNPSQHGCIPLSATLQSFVLHCNDLPPFARARSQHMSAATRVFVHYRLGTVLISFWRTILCSFCNNPFILILRLRTSGQEGTQYVREAVKAGLPPGVSRQQAHCCLLHGNPIL